MVWMFVTVVAPEVDVQGMEDIYIHLQLQLAANSPSAPETEHIRIVLG
jgi:hypothetical protein